MNLLPTLLPTGAVSSLLPSLQSAKRSVDRVQLIHKTDWTGDQLHPIDNFQLEDPYGPAVSNKNAEAALRLIIKKTGDLEPERNALAIALVQYGIDVFAFASTGTRWFANGGHDLGYRLPLSLAAFLLQNEDMKTTLKSAPADSFAESDMVYYSARAKKVLWGQDRCNYEGGREAIYWQDLTAEAARVCIDPYGYIDGGAEPGGWYQGCCTSQALLGSALIVRIIPGLQDVYANEAQLDYADRWHDLGAWTQADPCAPLSQGGGPNQSRPGECVLDPDLEPGATFTSFRCQAGKKCGRFPDLHGTGANNGLYKSGLLDAAWTAYRHSVAGPRLSPPARPRVSSGN